MFKDFKYTTILCCFKFRKQVNVSLLQFQILKLKEKFGVDYMTLVSENASVEDLKECLRTALEEISVREEEIQQNLREISRKELRVNGKMRKVKQSAEPPKTIRISTDKSLMNRSRKSFKNLQDQYQEIPGSSSSFSVNGEDR